MVAVAVTVRWRLEPDMKQEVILRGRRFQNTISKQTRDAERFRDQVYSSREIFSRAILF